jgi:hypothetical protein
MSKATSAALWECGDFAVSTTGGRLCRYGSFWSHWGIHRAVDTRFAVTHLPSGMRLTQFPNLRIARWFCEQIYDLTNWPVIDGTGTTDPDLSLQEHRAALRITSARPALIRIKGCALEDGRRWIAPSLREPAVQSAQRPRMHLVGWKPLVKDTLRGLATVELPIGLKLDDCPVFVGPKGPWASLPSKPVLDREERQARPGCKPQFSPVVEWRNRGLADRFSAAVIALVEGAHPDMLSGRAP